MKNQQVEDYYYNPNVECTCEAIFADTHRGYCKRRVRPKDKLNEQVALLKKSSKPLTYLTEMGVKNEL